jgi:hypothetical protein
MHLPVSCRIQEARSWLAIAGSSQSSGHCVCAQSESFASTTDFSSLAVVVPSLPLLPFHMLGYRCLSRSSNEAGHKQY